MTTFEELKEGNQWVLRDAIAVLALVDDEEYVRVPSAAHGSSIGEHLRHVVDHYLALIASHDGIVDYTRRRRGTAVENDRAAARVAVRSAEAALARLVDRDIEVCLDATVAGDRHQRVRSTLARELAFVSSHAIHHFALVALLLTVLGKQAPEDFGVAPTTLKWRRQQSVPPTLSPHQEPRVADIA